MNSVEIFNKYKVGIYAPYDKRSIYTTKYEMLETDVFNVENTDCGFWFINPEIVKVFKKYNFKELTRYGWGIDIITIKESLRLGFKVLRDYRSETDQLDHSTNYNIDAACKAATGLINKYNKHVTMSVRTSTV